MTNRSSFFENCLEDKEKNCVVFNELRRLRRQEIENIKDEAGWREPFKIYPSQLSFDMCPWKYFQNINKASNFLLQSFYKMKAGTSKHWEIQQDFLKSKLLYEKPQNLTKEQASKLKLHWPEVPFTNDNTMISGRVDLLLNIKDMPVVIEIKTVYGDPEQYLKDIEKGKLPDEKHKCQAAICAHQINALALLDKPIEKFILMYLNPRFEPGDQDAEHEFHFELKDYQEKCDILIEHLVKERERFLSSTESKCSFPNCREHKNGN